jgi:hypothetical protein
VIERQAEHVAAEIVFGSSSSHGFIRAKEEMVPTVAGFVVGASAVGACVVTRLGAAT